MEKDTKNNNSRGEARRRQRGYSIVELLIAISALTLGLVAAYAAQLSAVSLSNVARETDLSTFASHSAMESVLARSFIQMIDPDPPVGSVDVTELACMQPPYDPRGFAYYNSHSSTYPDAPPSDYLSANTTLYNKVLSYGARVWQPVQSATQKTDPATNVTYTLYPIGQLQRPKILVWFEPRPIMLNGSTAAYCSTVVKNNFLGYPALVPTLADPNDLTSGQPSTIVTAIGWYPLNQKHDSTKANAFNPLDMFVPPNDGSSTFTTGEIAQFQNALNNYKQSGLRVQYSRTVVRP
ncbi:MAG: prepilin-type N-terminal cleavage/methylation domain-containing protein [Planctomycetes bacterium]|nr:prepilin-type N-terminal cleavage/methylation domain-containing protein [Planctomycetota bacterium]